MNSWVNLEEEGMGTDVFRCTLLICTVQNAGCVYQVLCSTIGMCMALSRQTICMQSSWEDLLFTVPVFTHFTNL